MRIRYDKTLDIATANSRKAKTWKNRRVQWSELIEKLATTTRTPETVAEYKAMSRDRQSEIKDVGGFVGGYCEDGRRTTIAHRSIICLDADFAGPDLWEDWGVCYGNAAALYSTHKHTPERPRLRLIVPLMRNVSPDEYQAIGRRIAATLGIDQFDDTTYDARRLMYWPSTSVDGEYVYKTLDAELLDPDAVLATYHNWADVSSWPTSSRVAEIARKKATKQQDPLEKVGLVGAFCRAYSIEEAIEAFVPAYVPCDAPGRYTYTEGSTAAGVIVYEHKFAYSHHATDPASEQLLNAWDLVRVHRFGELDADADPDARASSLPSYKAMSHMAAEDPRVKMELLQQRTAEAMDDYAEPADTMEPDNAWTAKLQVTDKGALAQTIDNAVIILTNDPALKGSIAYNELTHYIVARKSLPWRKIDSTSNWTDTDDAALRYYMERTYNLSGKDRIFDAVNVIAQANAFHPIRDYLSACEWDGVKRVDTLLIDYFGAEDNVYTRAVTRKTLAAAVARVFRPGCKFDYILTLRGAQGIGKTTFFSKLGGEWFSNSFSTLQGKEAYEQVQGVWIVEIGELAGMRKSEVETIKLYISKQVDRFRAAYGRRVQDYPRQCIFIGTTNESQFLRDATGNRRWWIVDTPGKPTRDVWDELTPEEVRQIWAEAVQIYKAGERLYLNGEEARIALDVQATYEEENPQVGRIAAYLDRKRPEGWDTMDLYARRQWLETTQEGTIACDKVSTVEIWVEALSGNPDRLDRYAVKELNQIMATLPGWTYQRNRQTKTPYGRQRYYARTKNEEGEQ